MKIALIMKMVRYLPAGLAFLWLVAGAVWAEDTAKDAAKGDPEFGGQILTLTEPKPEIGESTNPRFRDNQDGTVTDLKLNVVWAKNDSYQVQKKWINWEMAQDYIRELNEKKFGGASNWRLPTREELASLYDESQSIPWNYYWTKNELHLDPVFGNSNCCYWSSEEYKDDMAWGFNYIRGKPYLSMKGGPQLSLSVIRAVRDVTITEARRN